MAITNKTQYNFAQAKDVYRSFCRMGENDIPVFAQPWFLDAVCSGPDDWQVIIYLENNRVLAAFPFEYVKSKRGGLLIKNPFQSKRLGIWIDYGNKKSNAARESFENKVSQFVIDNLPAFDYFNIEFDSRYTNWRAFFNNGFNQQTKYSYIIPKMNSLNDYDNLLTSKRRSEVNRNRKTLDIVKQQDIELFWSFLVETYLLRNKQLGYSEHQLKRLLKAAVSNNAVDFYFSKNKEGRIVGAKVYFKDSRKSYEMFSTFDPREKPSPLPLLTYSAILDAAEEGLIFDFEGSMDSGVALYNREFGGAQEPYFVISKVSDRYLLFNDLREVGSLISKKLLRILR